MTELLKKLLIVTLLFGATKLAFFTSLYAQTISDEYIKNNIEKRTSQPYKLIYSDKQTNYFLLEDRGVQSVAIVMAIHNVDENTPIMNLKINDQNLYSVPQEIINEYEEGLFKAIVTKENLPYPPGAVYISHYVKDVYLLSIRYLRKNKEKEGPLLRTFFERYDVWKNSTMSQFAEFYSLTVVDAKEKIKKEEIGMGLTEVELRARNKEIKIQREHEIEVERYNNLANNGYVVKESDFWNKFPNKSEMLKNLFEGDFRNLQKDKYFKYLFCAYVYYKSINCYDLLPEDAIEHEFEYSTFDQQYSHSSYIGKNTYIHNYNRNETKHKYKIYVDPKFDNDYLKYKEELDGVLYKEFLSLNFERANTYIHNTKEIRDFIDLIGCNKSENKILSENIIRFNNDQSSLQAESGIVFR